MHINFPQVTIVIPVFNRVDLLKNTLRSLTRQTYTNFEVLLIDDASETVFEIQEFEEILVDISFKFHKLLKNEGPGKARCFGRTLAKGKYVAYLDSDDFWKPRFLEKTVALLENEPTISMVFTNVLINRLGEYSKRLLLQSGMYNFYDLIFKDKIYWATGAALWRSDISLSLNWHSFRDHEDYVHDILSLVHKPRIYFISEALCVVNKNDVLGIPRSNNEMLKSLILLLQNDELYKKLSFTSKKEFFLNFVFWRISKRRYKKEDVVLLLKLYISLIRWSAKFINISIRFMKLMRQKFSYYTS